MKLIDVLLENIDLSSAVPEDTSYKDFAKAVAKLLKEDYGSHNIEPFMKALHAELGLDEVVTEQKEMTLGDLELGVNLEKGSTLPIPNSDARSVINNQQDLDRYVERHGADTPIVYQEAWEGAGFKRYEIPAYTDGIEKAVDTKAAGIKKFGTSA